MRRHSLRDKVEGRSPAPLLAALLLASFFGSFVLGACGSSQVEGSELESVRARQASAPRHAGGPPIIEGTTVDAATGEPLAGVLVTGPGEVTTRSDERGRFRLRGLPHGAQGELVATTDSGLTGAVRLLPLAGRPLEVVIHLRRPPE